MVLFHPDSKPAIVSFVVSDPDVNQSGHGFGRRQGADGHYPTVGQQNRSQNVAVKQEAHLYIDVLRLEAVRGKEEGKLADDTSPSSLRQRAVHLGHEREALLF